MMALIIAGCTLGYLACAAVCTAVMLADDEKPDDDDIFRAAGWSLLWPFVGTLYGIGQLGVYTHRRLRSQRDRKLLPMAKVVK
jgi:hypothetical protein